MAQLVLDRVIEGTELVIPNPTPGPPPLIGNVIISSNNFRVIRQPRPLVGEPMLQLHKDVYIDLTRSHPCPGYLQAVKQFPPSIQYPSPPYKRFHEAADWAPYVDPVTNRACLDILFNSNGSVANAPFGQMMLWVQHVDRQGPGQRHDALLLTIFTRTGKIAPYSIFDLDPTQFDPYGTARAGESPGL